MDLRNGISSRHPGISRLHRSHLAGFAVFLLLQSLPLVVPDLRRSWFSEPAAHAAAAFLGAPIVIESGTLILAHPKIDVAITEACSGFQFFSLLAALLAGLVFFRGKSKTLLRDAFLVPVASYGLTLACNASRIVCAVQIRSTTRGLIPPSFDAIIHQLIGAVVFVTVLAIAWTLTSLYYDRRNPA